jgi:hypothetical protein
MRAGLKRIVGKEVRASFLKKSRRRLRSKKLLIPAGCDGNVPAPTVNESFFASFFSKKEALALPLCLSKQASRGCQISLA